MLTVTVACKATPERTHVRNNRGRAITIKTVGSIYRPYSYEPFRVDRKVGGGNSITFESGSGANAKFGANCAETARMVSLV